MRTRARSTRPAVEAPATRGASLFEPSSRPSTAVLTRMDAHVHSHASSGPAMAALGAIGCPECYSPPEKVYDQARSRAMDLVTLTDHDTIAGALELHERGFQNFVIGEEVTVHFPEDRCKLHVLVWGLTPAQHEEIGADRLRDDVYAFAHWLRRENLPHSLAHPLYIQNGRLSLWHIERCVLLFKCFETLNGAHSGTHASALEKYLGALTPASIQRFATRHAMEPIWPRSWEKGRTGGSDDHGLLNAGRTWTGVLAAGDDAPGGDPRAFFRHVMGARCEPGGVAGHAALLAHQLATVACHFGAEKLRRSGSARLRYAASRVFRFAGATPPAPSRLALLASVVGARFRRRRGSVAPLIHAVTRAFGPVLDRYPDIRRRLDPAAWSGAKGPALADHDRTAEFADDLSAALVRAMSSGALAALRRRDKGDILNHLASYGLLLAAQAPYIVSLFHQNKERSFVQRVEREADGLGAPEPAPVPRRPAAGSPLRVLLFTDTLGDVNGVSRFIRNIAEQATLSGRDLRVVTSTRLAVPPGENIHNFDPVLAGAMPKYENLELVLPPVLPMLRFADKVQPDAIHVSTPGPVGSVGFLAAKMLRVPILGVYHTDFPAYIDHLFQDHALTWIAERFMKSFYGSFRTIFTRSEDYASSLEALGLRRDRILPLLPGIDTDLFHIRFRDPSVWDRVRGRSGHVLRGAVKALYVGRVSVEKNLPFLAGVWKRVHKACREKGLDAELLIVGDGPYRAAMERDLHGAGAHFLGFRHGEELSTIYASSDLFLFPSTTDTLGQVVMESQSSGLPVIVTDQGGPKEVVQEGATGRIVSADKPAAWADAVVQLVADPERRRRMGAAGHTAMQGMSIRHSFDRFWEAHEKASMAADSRR